MNWGAGEGHNSTHKMLDEWIQRMNMCGFTQLCLTVWDLRDCSPPSCSVHEIIPARILEWVVILSSGGSSWPRDWTHISCVSCIGRQILYHWASWEAPMHWTNEYKKYDPWCCDDKKCAFKHSLFSSYRAPFTQPHLAIWIRCSNFPYYSWSPTYSGNMTGTLWNFSFHCKLTWMVRLVIMGRRIQVVGNPVSSTNIFFQCLRESP